MNSRTGVRLRAAGIAALCALALAACNDKSDDPKADADPTSAATSDATSAPSEASSSTTSATTDDGSDGTAGESGVEVLDHGSGDQQVLALHLTEGARATTSIEMTMTMSSKGLDLPTIPLTMTMSSEVLEVGDDRSTVRATYDSVEVGDGVAPDLRASLEPEFAILKGIAITFDYAPSGTLLDTRVALPDDAPPSAQQLVDQISNSLSGVGMTFPSEPVGVGASWRSESTVGSVAVNIDQTTTYTLEEFDGENYRVSIEGSGEVQPGSTGAATVTAGSVTTTGEIEGSLDQVVPLHGTTRASTDMVIEASGQKVRTTTDIDMTITTTEN
ncbi:DUF6263 family protein [Nocardioides sp. MH1]|uniref:DUF6263 family protein n=1 Tax=Nocardioides sp. MH1 TaxID=3242490 RepID=UPI0035227665